MRYIFFSKMVREQSIPQLIQSLKRIGADGVDLAVRPGYPVNPDNVRKALPEAAKQIKEAGLAIPLVSTPTDLIDPSKPYVEELWAACHDAQIPHVKIGYWQHRGKDYWKIVDRARKDLEGFEKLAMRFGVKPCLHTHSGNYVGVNASSVMHIVKGFNPNGVGVYLDPGHLQVNGEPLSVAFDMVAEYLSLVAVKDSYCKKSADGKTRESHFVPLGQGFVDWREMMRILKARNYDGPLSFHSEYEGLATDALIEQTKKDMAYMRAVEKLGDGGGVRF